MKVAPAENPSMNDVGGIFAREFPAVDGYVQLGVAQGRVISVDFPARPQDDAGPDHDLLGRIGAYFDGEADSFRSRTGTHSPRTCSRLSARFPTASP